MPRKRVEEAQTAVKVIDDEIASADKQVVLLGDQIKSAQAGQAIFRSPTVRQPSRNFPLISPITGIIDQIKATSGQQVASGAELLNIVNLSTVLLEAQVFEKDLATVRESTRASFTSSALLGEVYTIGTADGDGRLVSIGQTVNDQTRTVPVIYSRMAILLRSRSTPAATGKFWPCRSQRWFVNRQRLLCLSSTAARRSRSVRSHSERRAQISTRSYQD